MITERHTCHPKRWSEILTRRERNFRAFVVGGVAVPEAEVALAAQTRHGNPLALMAAWQRAGEHRQRGRLLSRDGTFLLYANIIYKPKYNINR